MILLSNHSEGKIRENFLSAFDRDGIISYDSSIFLVDHPGKDQISGVELFHDESRLKCTGKKKLKKQTLVTGK